MRLLITGASGQLGGYLLRELRDSPLDVIPWSYSRTGELFGRPLQPVDLTKRECVVESFRAANPTAILHLAAYSRIAECYADLRRAESINVQGTALLAELATAANARMMMVSTDLVFDGAKGNYSERDTATPLSVYGRTKLGGEAPVLATPGGAVVRISLMFGATIIGRPYFFDQQLAKMRAGQETTWFTDEWRSPIGLLAAARTLLALVQSDFTGLLHVGGRERMSRYEMGLRFATYCNADPAKVIPVLQASVPTPEPRPKDTSLDSSLWHSLFPDHWRPDW